MSKSKFQRRELILMGMLSALPFSSCTEPPEKPITPLDLSKAKKEEPAPKEEKAEPAGPIQRGSMTRMPLGDLYQLVESRAAVIYDVRPTLFYKMGHIPGAISWPEKQYYQELSKHRSRIVSANKQNTPVVVYCTDLACPDATNVASRLASLGYDVSVLQGGYEAWKVAVN